MLCSKILVAYNESELAKKSLEIALEIAKTHPDIEIDVLNVIELPRSPFIVGNVWNEIEQSLKSHGEELLSEAKERLSTIDNPTHAFIKQGEAIHVILDHAKEHHSDLIIMGSRGLSGVKEFLGSVSHYVLQHSPIPVLIIK